jgi:hypothetical protein
VDVGFLVCVAPVWTRFCIRLDGKNDSLAKSVYLQCQLLLVFPDGGYLVLKFI